VAAGKNGQPNPGPKKRRQGRPKQEPKQQQPSPHRQRRQQGHTGARPQVVHREHKPRVNPTKAQPEVGLALRALAFLLKCSPFHWIPGLRRVPGWARVLVWVILLVAFYKISPETLGKVVGGIVGLALCPGLLILAVVAIVKAPKGRSTGLKRRKEEWHPSGISNKDWDDMNDPRGDSTNPHQF
jgi:hypothetical protein